MDTNDFRDSLRPLYPELGAAPPDPEAHAESVILRVLNTGPDALREQMLTFYGPERVRAVARARVNRLDTPVYRAWKARLQLPDRGAAAERIQRLWRQ